MKYSTAYILLFLGFSSCTKELKVDFGEPSRKIVFYPFLTNNKKITIKMSGPAGILSTSFPILENATVIITDNSTPVDTVIIDAKGKGNSKIIPACNHEYGFKATATGYPAAFCTAQLPKPVESFSVDTVHLYVQFLKHMTARLRIKDDPNSTDYYKATIYSKRILTQTIIKPTAHYDSIYTRISSIELNANVPDIGFFYSRSLGKFLLAQDVLNFGDESGFKFRLGSEIYFQGSEFYFPDDVFNGKEMILNIMVNGSIGAIYPGIYLIELSTISEDYYMGVKSYARYGTKEYANLPLSGEVSIYSAVKGGYGFPMSSTSVIDSSYWMPRYK